MTGAFLIKTTFAVQLIAEIERRRTRHSLERHGGLGKPGYPAAGSGALRKCYHPPRRAAPVVTPRAASTQEASAVQRAMFPVGVTPRHSGQRNSADLPAFPPYRPPSDARQTRSSQPARSLGHRVRPLGTLRAAPQKQRKQPSKPFRRMPPNTHADRFSADWETQ